MMRTLSTYFGTAVIVASLIGCVSTDPNDILTTTSFTDTLTDATDTDTTDSSSETSGDSASGDGDGDTTSGDGDGDTASGDGDGDPATDTDTDTDGPTGCFNCPCGPGGECDEGLECDDTNTCQLPSETTDETTDTGGEDPWDPNMCAPPSQPLMIGGLDGTFCSAPCMGDQDCPVGPAGTMGACALVTMEGADPEFCALICSPEQDACPSGSSCKEVPNQPGVGLCTYP